MSTNDAHEANTPVCTDPAYVRTLLEELAQKDGLLAEMRVELEQYQNGHKTIRPSCSCVNDEPTGDLRADKAKADELDALRMNNLRMDRELAEIYRRLDEYKPIMERVAAILEQGFCSHCPNRPPPPPPVSLVPKAAEGV